MKTIFIEYNNVKIINEPINLCLGYFDGLHVGHKLLINKAKDNEAKSALLTFDFSKDVVLKNKKYLTSIQDKEEILISEKVDYLIVLKFDERIKNLSKEEFIDFLKDSFNIKKLITGFDFRFGKNASGNNDTLKEYFDLEVINEYKIDNHKVSTSLIINNIENGNVEYAKENLGRYYSIKNKVIHGKELGRKIKFPTANISLGSYVKPKDGVYATFVIIDNKRYLGFANVGVHPTVNELINPLIEIHIFDYNENLYDKYVKVEFVKMIRDELKFNSVDDLVNQLEKDKITSITILEETNKM